MLLKTKLIALDIYGTVLHSHDTENRVPPREGLLNFLLQARQKGIGVITYSDADLRNLKIDLKDSGVDISLFDDFYYMDTQGGSCPKDPDVVLRDFNLRPDQLLVIGNDEYLDLSFARAKGCKTLLVPSYDALPDHFDFTAIKIE